MRNFYALLVTLLVCSLSFGQTTIAYDFSATGASTADNLDSNISFTTAQNLAATAPNIVTGQLRLYGDGTKGGSILITPLNGVTITDVVINASIKTNNAAYTVDGSIETDLSAINNAYTISAISATSEVEFYQKKNGNNKQIYVDTFEVTYTTTPVTFTYDGTWSPSDPNGTATSNDAIIIASGDATLTTNTTVNSITVDAGAGLTVDTGVTLTATNGLTLESTSTSYSSLILNGTITGDITYNRHVNNAPVTGASSTANDLISPPLSGMTFGDLRLANSNILSGTVSGGSITFYLFGPFDNSSANKFVLFEETVDDGVVLNTGVGYRTGSTDNGSYTFTGTAETGPISETITIPSGGSRWNLIGNPYPSYIKLTDFLSANTGKFSESSAGVYGYDGDASNGHTIWNNLYAAINPDALIAPGQGFFVASNTASEVVNFTASMRSSGASDDFIPMRSTSAITNVRLDLSSATNNYTTDVFFTQFSTLGLDPGYDASVFGGSAPAFSIYSHLVEDNTGVPMSIQALGETDYGDTTVALGINANQGEELTISLTTNTLPSTVSVYLEDTLTKTSTVLNSGDYVFTPSSDLSDTGRFYLRFADSALSLTTNELDALRIYSNTIEKTITINGQLLETASASLYDLEGRLVSKTQLETTKSNHTITVGHLSSGIYVLHISGANYSKSQKIVLK